MYFSYNGTRDWLNIECRDQSCMDLEVVARFDSFLLFLRDSSPAYEIFLLTGLIFREKTCLNTNTERYI